MRKQEDVRPVREDEDAAAAVREEQAAGEVCRAEDAEAKRTGQFEIEDGVLLRYNGKLKRIAVPDGVRAIGEGAFRNVDYEEVTLPASVTVIGKYAFSHDVTEKLGHMRRVTLEGRTLEEIGEGAFRDACIAAVYLPSCLKRIGRRAFAEGQLLLYEGSRAEFDEKFSACYVHAEECTASEYAPRFENQFLEHCEGIFRTADGTVYACGGKETFLCGWTRVPRKGDTFRFPEEVEGRRVTGIAQFAYTLVCERGSEYLFLPHGLRRIPANALDVPELLEVFIPNTVKRIGMRAVRARTVTFERGILLEEWSEDSCLMRNYKGEAVYVCIPPCRDEERVNVFTVTFDARLRHAAELRLSTAQRGARHEALLAETFRKSSERFRVGSSYPYLLVTVNGRTHPVKIVKNMTVRIKKTAFGAKVETDAGQSYPN